jgi:hypothetical protein
MEEDHYLLKIPLGIESIRQAQSKLSKCARGMSEEQLEGLAYMRVGLQKLAKAALGKKTRLCTR